MSNAVLDRVLAIPELAPDFVQMGISGKIHAALVERGGVRKDGVKAKTSVLKQDRSKTLIKGDRLLSDKEQKEAQRLKKQEFRDRVGNLTYAPVGIAPTTKKARAMIDSMDEKELAKYESRTKGQVSRRYTVGAEKAKKRIENLQDQINSLSTTVNNQNENLLKAQNVKANRAGRNAVKKRSKDNPHGLEADGIGAPHTKSAQKVRSLAKIHESSTQELQNLRSKQRSLMSIWGDRIAIKDRKDAQEKTHAMTDRFATARKVQPKINVNNRLKKIVEKRVKKSQRRSKNFRETTESANLRLKEDVANRLLSNSKRFTSKKLQKKELGGFLGESIMRPKKVKSPRDIRLELERKGQARLF